MVSDASSSIYDGASSIYDGASSIYEAPAPPATPRRRASHLGHKPRGSFASPVNLPVRSDADVAQQPRAEPWPQPWPEPQPPSPSRGSIVSPGLSPARTPGRSPSHSPHSSPHSSPSRSLNGSPHSSPSRSPSRSPARSPARSPPAPSSQNVTPRRSFYLENAVPLPGDELVDAHAGAHAGAHVATVPAVALAETEEPALIFDDGDERLPPPEASPSRASRAHAGAEPDTMADIVAISSPLASPGAASYLQDAAGPDDDLDLTLLADGGGAVARHEVYGLVSPRPAAPRYAPSLSPSEALHGPPAHGQPYYPAPVPATLYKPPLLSRRSKHRRKSSAQMEDLPSPPQWGASPLEELPGLGRSGSRCSTPALSAHGLGAEDDEAEGSDVDSDRATIMSNDRDEFDQPLGNPFDDGGAADAGGRGWVARLFGRRKHGADAQKDEMGERFDAREAGAVQQQLAPVDVELAFTRLDPETVQRHSQMFNAGGLHDSVAPRHGGPTSLIEELEIRKAGKRIQKQVFRREITEIERQRAEDAAATPIFHPVDIPAHQPTLMQMQHMASVDYDARVQWHQRALNRQYMQEHSGETLAQRRARLRAAKQQGGRTGGAPPAEQETLAQRRQRLRQQRQSALLQSLAAETASVASSGSARAEPDTDQVAAVLHTDLNETAAAS